MNFGIIDKILIRKIIGGIGVYNFFFFIIIKLWSSIKIFFFVLKLSYFKFIKCIKCFYVFMMRKKNIVNIVKIRVGCVNLVVLYDFLDLLIRKCL